jgi:hypothetical protein
VHVSASFLLTKGLNAALYLMLLRLLARQYDEVYRLTDSVATDTALNPEGKAIFAALGLAAADAHPDAHACRLKIALLERCARTGNGLVGEPFITQFLSDFLTAEAFAAGRHHLLDHALFRQPATLDKIFDQRWNFIGVFGV